MNKHGDIVHRVGIIGAGSRGREIMRVLAKSGRGRVVAVADPHAASRETAREMLPEDCPIHEDLRRVLDDPQVEIVYVGAPSHVHGDIVIASLAAGKATLCDKPMAVTLDQCDRMIEAVERSGCFFGLTMQNRYSFWATTMSDLLRRGELGEVKMMWCHEFRRPFSRRKVGDWIVQDAKCGGVFLEKNSHHWDIFNCWAQAPPVSVYAQTQNTGVHRPGDIWDCGWANVTYENGIIASLGLSLISPHGHDLHMGMIGTKGWAESLRTRDGGTVHFHDNAQATPQTYHCDMKPEHAQMGHAGAEFPMLNHLLDCLEQGVAPDSDCWWGRESIIVGLAAEKSAREGRAVPIAEIGPAMRRNRT